MKRKKQGLLDCISGQTKNSSYLKQFCFDENVKVKKKKYFSELKFHHICTRNKGKHSCIGLFRQSENNFIIHDININENKHYTYVRHK